MKIAYLGIVLASLLIAMSYAKPVHADSTDPVQILGIHVEPSMPKVNDTFSISTTILNSSPYPIYLTSGSCTPAFSVSFDIHAKQVYPNISCTSEAILQKVDPEGEATISNNNKPGTIYQAVLPGTANANITILYFTKNQTATDYSDIDYMISKSFQFLIHDSNKTLQKPPTYFLPPLQQIRAGALAQNVKCSANFNLIIKSDDGFPACVKPDTAKILSERGWATTFATGIVMNAHNPPTNTSPSAENLTATTPIIPKTYDVRGTVSWALPNIPLMKMASTTTGMQISRGEGFDSYDHSSVRLELYYGKTSDSNIIIASTVVNMKNMPVHIYGINIQGRISYTNDTSALALQSTSEIMPKEDAILGQGESQTRYIIGNWTTIGKPINVFSVSTDYSYDSIQNYDGITNGYQMTIPVQQIP